MRAAAVWQCVQQISGDVAKLHLNCKRVESRTSPIDKSHPSQKIVRRRWNDETSAFQGWRTIMIHALLWGNGYAFIDRNGRGDVIGLYNLLPDRTTIERINGELVYITETTRPDGTPWLRPIPKDDILHIRGMSADGISGLDLLKYARDAVGNAIATEGFQAKFFRNGIRHGGILMLPREMSDKAKGKVEEGFKREHTGQSNWFKTVILRDGAKFESAQSSLRDAQMVELDEQLARKVARFFNVAPSRVGLSDSVSYNSKTEDNQSYLDTTLSPWLLAITGECWLKLLSGANQDQETHEFEHDVSQLLRLNRLARYQIYSIAKRSRIMTTNECRTDDGLPPMTGGDDLDQPTTPAGGADKGGPTPARGPADQSGGQVPVDQMRQLERRRIVFDVASQARNKAQKPGAFLQWVDGGLISHRERCRRAGIGESLVGDMVARLKEIAATATAAVLMERVDQEMTMWETQS